MVAEESFRCVYGKYSEEYLAFHIVYCKYLGKIHYFTADPTADLLCKEIARLTTSLYRGTTFMSHERHVLNHQQHECLFNSLLNKQQR